MKLKSTLIAATSALAIVVAASSPANAGPQYDFAMRLNGQNQINYVNAIIANYNRTIPVYENLVNRYGHYSWAASFKTRLQQMRDEVSLLQGILDAQTDVVTEVGKETVYSAEFDVVQQGVEQLAETRVREVEEEADGIVRVYEEITRLYERPDTVRHYRGRVIYTIYSNGERVPLVSPELLSTKTVVEARQETERNFLREYAVVAIAEPTVDSEFGIPTENVLTAEEYRNRDDVMMAGTQNYMTAALTTNSRINPDYINRVGGMAEYANSLGYVGAPEAWAKGWTGLGSTIAILDTGIDLDHPEFAGRIAGAECFSDMCNDPRLVAAGTNETIQDNNRYSHGTHVAGIAAAALDGVGTTGVAPDAELLIAKVASDSGYVDMTKVDDAIRWAVSNGADVMNLSANFNVDTIYRNSVISLGNGVFTATDTRSTYATAGYTNLMTDDYMLPAFAESMQGHDAVIVMAAGNQRLEYPTFPAHFAIAEDENGDLLLGGRAIIAGNWDVKAQKLASVSNAAGTMCFDVAADGTCNSDRRISDWYILAPGQNVASTDANGGYRINSGTSMAAPTVSGGVALIHQMWPHMKGENIVQLLLNTADKTIAGYDVNVHGQGLMDLDEATNPQGAIGIPTTGRIDGYNSNIANVRTMSIAGANISALSSMMVVDDYDRDFYVNGNNMNMASASTALSYTDFAGLTIMGNAANLSVSQDGSFALERDFGGFAVGVLNETETFLGNRANNMLVDVNGATTVYAGVNYEYTDGAATWFGAANIGVTELDVGNSMMKSASSLVSNSATFGAKLNTGNGTFAFTAGLPVAITSGDATFEMAQSVSVSGDIEVASMTSSLANTARQVDFGVSYEFNITETATVSTFASFSDNYGSIRGMNDSNVGVNYMVRF